MIAKSSGLLVLVSSAILLTLACLPASFSLMEPSTLPMLQSKQASRSVLSRRVAAPSSPTKRALQQSAPMSALCFAGVAVLMGAIGRRQESCVARRGVDYKLPVRQWAPIKIPPSERRAPEDRIRFKLYCFHPMHLEECVEILDDFAKEIGGETEGPKVHPPTCKNYALNKSPQGHKKAKYKFSLCQYMWIHDFYPPAEGGLDSLLRLRLPHQVKVEIE